MAGESESFKTYMLTRGQAATPIDSDDILLILQGGDTVKQITTADFLSAVETTLTSKAPLNSPILTGTPEAPTPNPSDSSLKISTTEFIQKATTALSRLQSISVSVAENVLTIGYAAPATLDFRNTALTNGAPVKANITNDLSLIIPSGATLGTMNGTQAQLAVLAIYNLGTVELAICNMAGGVSLGETSLITTTAISALSNSANTVYSTSARANVPYRVVGFFTITEAVAGTWATAPTLVQGAGGQTMSGLMSLGYSQTWQNMIAARAYTVTYYNTTGRSIMVCVTGQYTEPGQTITLRIDGVAVAAATLSSYSADACVGGIVPPGSSYTVTLTGNPALEYWAELR